MDMLIDPIINSKIENKLRKNIYIKYSRENDKCIYIILNYIVKSYRIDNKSKSKIIDELLFYVLYNKESKQNNDIPIVNMISNYKTINHIYMIFEYNVYSLFDIYLLQNEYIKETSIKCFIKNILKSLVYIHKNNYIHGDIKPENIVCSNKELTDFKLINFNKYYKLEDLKYIKHYITTIYYISPEQYNYEKINQSTDIYSLGVTIIELLQYNIFKDEILLNRKYSDININLIKTHDIILDDLLSKFLTYDPLYRITAKDALKHDYFKY